MLLKGHVKKQAIKKGDGLGRSRPVAPLPNANIIPIIAQQNLNDHAIMSQLEVILDLALHEMNNKFLTINQTNEILTNNPFLIIAEVILHESREIQRMNTRRDYLTTQENDLYFNIRTDISNHSRELKKSIKLYIRSHSW